MVNIFPTEHTEVTDIRCPRCRWVVPHVKLKRDSIVSGLTFRCGRCRELLELEARPILKKEQSQSP